MTTCKDNTNIAGRLQQLSITGDASLLEGGSQGAASPGESPPEDGTRGGVTTSNTLSSMHVEKDSVTQNSAAVPIHLGEPTGSPEVNQEMQMHGDDAGVLSEEVIAPPDKPEGGGKQQSVELKATMPLPKQEVAPRGPGPPAESVVAGMGPALELLREVIVWPSLYAEEAAYLGVCWPRGVLLHGPPGCGKTMLVQAVAAEAGAHVHYLTAGMVFGPYTGQSEERLRDAFDAAAAEVAGGHAVVLFLDEVDALCPSRDASRPHESRVVAQLLTLLDGAATPRETRGHLVVVAATNRPNALDPALRRPGRLDREVAVPVPDVKAREAILRLKAASLPLAPDLDLGELAARCHGYSGADLAALCREAAMQALTGTAAAFLDGKPEGALALAGAADDDLEPVGWGHFQAAMKLVGPSITRGYQIDLPPVSWDDIGGLPEVKQRLQQAVEWPIKYGDAFARLGLAPPRGVLLHGPPGCCKTGLARAAVTASGATLQALSGAQLFSAYLGEGEALLRDAFSRARMAAPAIIFIDELDAVAGRRTEGAREGGGGEGSAARLLAALLTEMDGLELATGVLVLAATNRVRAIDPALLRPGRFDLILYVPPPDEEGRLETLKIHTRDIPLEEDVNLEAVAAQTERFTGAELEGVCREATLAALRENPGAERVGERHFFAGLAGIRPSLTPHILEEYESWDKH